MKIINTKEAPGAIGPYSQAVDTGTMLYTSGQLPINPLNGEMPAGIEAQTEQSLLNVEAILGEAGLGTANVVKTLVFLADMSLFGAMNEVYARHFKAPYPARSAVAVRSLPKDALVEIEVVAAR